MENKSKKITRRKFLGTSALGLTGLTILPSWTINGIRVAPSDRITLGFIGLGRQGISIFMHSRNARAYKFWPEVMLIR